MASKDKFSNYDNGQLNVRCGFNFQDYATLITFFIKINDDNLFGIEFITDLFLLEDNKIYFYEIKNCKIDNKHINEFEKKLYDLKYNYDKVFISSFTSNDYESQNINIIYYDYNKIMTIIILKIRELFNIKVKRISNSDIESFVKLIKTKIFDDNLNNWKLNKINSNELLSLDLLNKSSLKNSCYNDRFFDKNDFRNIIINSSGIILNKVTNYFLKRKVIKW